MSQDVIVKSMSGPFAKALSINHGPNVFESVTPFPSEPRMTAANPVDGDGVPDLGVHFAQVPNWLLFLPYAEAEPGETFSMRVWGFRRFTAQNYEADQVIWMNYLLGEFYCTVGAQPGPPYNLNSPRPLADKFMSQSENLCDTITLTHGVANLTSIITSPGSDTGSFPGVTGLTASILQDTLGSTKIYFDFQPEIASPTITMNCAWARA